jgi:REP element-mobilizing transposase RayT
MKSLNINLNPKNLLLSALFIGQPIWAQDVLKGEELLSSPYFVDGVHCEGFSFEKESYWPYKEEDAAIMKKAQFEGACIGFFASYGIKLFQWYTPENLQNLTNLMRKTEEFNAVDVSIKKSELPNHIHLFVKFAPDQTNKKHLSFETRSYAGNKKEKPRQTNKLAFEWTNNKNYPIATNTYGFKNLRSTAANLIDMKEAEIEKMPTEILAQPNYFANDLYADFKFPYGRGGHGVHFGFHLLTNNINTSKSLNTDSYYTLGFTDKTYSPLGTNEWGLLLEHSSVVDFDYDPQSKKSKVHNIDRVGLSLKSYYGNLKGDYLGTNIIAYAPRGPSDKTFGLFDFDLRWSMAGNIPQAYITYKGIFDETKEVGNYRRFLLEQNNTFELGVNKYLKTTYGDTQISGFVGSESLYFPQKAGTNYEKEFRRNSGYAGIKGLIATEGWNIEAKFGIYEGRLQ